MRQATYTGRHPRGTSTRPLRALALDLATWAVALVAAYHLIMLDWTTF